MKSIILVGSIFLMSLQAWATPTSRSCSYSDDNILTDAIFNGVLQAGSQDDLNEVSDMLTLYKSGTESVVLCSRLLESTADGSMKFTLGQYTNRVWHITVVPLANGGYGLELHVY